MQQPQNAKNYVALGETARSPPNPASSRFIIGPSLFLNLLPAMWRETFLSMLRFRIFSRPAQGTGGLRHLYNGDA